MVAGHHIADWISRLVQIPSVNPEQAGPRAGEAGEGRIAAAIEEWFRELGGEVYRDEVLPGRPNVYGVWPGRSDRWAAVDVHVDTVSVEQMTGDPFSGEVRDGRVHGRGAVDTKATLGVVLALIEAMRRSGRAPEPNLLVAATVDEEVGARGAPAFAAWVRRQGLSLDELVVAEATGCGPVVAHKGVLRLEFQVSGAPAHSCQPQMGRNAVTAAAHLILALAAEHERLQSVAPVTGLGHGTLTVTLIHGGRGMNVVPDECTLAIDRRLLPGERAAEVRRQLEALAAEACSLPVTPKLAKAIDAFSQPPDAPWVRRLAEWSGREPSVVPYCTNAWAYRGLAKECVVIGPGSIDQAHGTEEWVDVAELEKLAGIFARWWGLV